MATMPPQPEVCRRCGALVPYQPEEKLKRNIIEFAVCQAINWHSGLPYHDKKCPGKPSDEASRKRANEARKALKKSKFGKRVKKIIDVLRNRVR